MFKTLNLHESRKLGSVNCQKVMLLILFLSNNDKI